MKVDILAFAAHPDDIELAASGTLLKQQDLGYTIGIVDLTAGELGTRGNAQLRAAEAKKASEIMQLQVRENLAMPDGFFELSEVNKRLIIESIRKHQPELILINAPHDRHPDHGRAAQLVKEAAFLSGLSKIETQAEGQTQLPWRPKNIYHYIQDYYIKPDFVVDITPFFEKKMACVLAYQSQFYGGNSKEAETPISSKDFIYFLEARAREVGRLIGVTYGEGFVTNTPLSIQNMMAFL
jgi:bacillithiol biosynthesis deacetylase BshB1